MIPTRVEAAIATAPVSAQDEIEGGAPEPAKMVGHTWGSGDLPTVHRRGRQIFFGLLPQQQAKAAARTRGK